MEDRLSAAVVGRADGPLVSVLVPVRNGGSTLGLVLDGLLEQSYRNIEILISDNSSSDSTEAICRDAMSRDARVGYVRQAWALTAIDNFRARLADARGTYVLFAAHDDLRDRDFIARLVDVAVSRRGISCVVPAVSRFFEYTPDPFKVVDPVAEPTSHYATTGAGTWNRLRFAVFNGFPCYGLIRREVLLDYPWYEIDYAPDMPLNIFLAMYGEVVVEPAAELYYWAPRQHKSAADRARENSLRRLAPFPELRLAWTCGKAAAIGCRRGHSRWLPVPVGFAGALLHRIGPRVGGVAYAMAPPSIRSLWRRLKRQLGWRLN